jgi:glycosyltransferase involved in cell wall biosynthesis
MNVLYLSYDGMTDPLGRSQVLPYVVGLAERGHHFTLISCEKRERSDGERQAVAKICRKAGIRWLPLAYHKRPPVLSTVFDIVAMRRLAFRFHRREKFELAHCRSYMAALVGLALKRKFGVPFIFDTRSFLPDERAESGMWPLRNPLFGAVYRYFKAREADFLREAGTVVCQTNAGAAVMRSWQDAGQSAPISVVPCCVDLNTFKPITPDRRAQARSLLGIEKPTETFVYLGSVGTWYMLPEMLDLFSVQLSRNPDSAFLIVTRDDPDPIRRLAEERGIPTNALIVRPATREEVPLLISAADYAFCFIKPLPSKVGSAPVKLGEYLASQIPVIANRSCGDVDEILAETGGGVVIDDFTPESYVAALQAIDRLVIDPSRLDPAVKRWFDLRDGVERYDGIYRRLAEVVGNRTAAR